MDIFDRDGSQVGPRRQYSWDECLTDAGEEMTKWIFAPCQDNELASALDRSRQMQLFLAFGVELQGDHAPIFAAAQPVKETVFGDGRVQCLQTERVR